MVSEVGLAGATPITDADGVFHSAFLPRAMRIAEEGLDAEGFVKSVMFGELVSVVEADCLAHHLWKFAKLAADFSIDWALNHAEAGFSFVESQQPLAAPGEQHEVGFPMTRRLAALDLGGTFGDRAPLFDEAGDAAASAAVMPSSSFLSGSRRCQGSFWAAR